MFFFSLHHRVFYSLLTCIRLGWFPEWITHHPFCESIPFPSSTSAFKSSSYFKSPFLRSPIISVNPASASMPFDERPKVRESEGCSNGYDIHHHHHHLQQQNNQKYKYFSMDSTHTSSVSKAPPSSSLSSGHLDHPSSPFHPKESSSSFHLFDYNHMMLTEEQLIDAIVARVVRPSRFPDGSAAHLPPISS